jgi:hypothetical protein
LYCWCSGKCPQRWSACICPNVQKPDHFGCATEILANICIVDQPACSRKSAGVAVIWGTKEYERISVYQNAHPHTFHDRTDFMFQERDPMKWNEPCNNRRYAVIKLISGGAGDWEWPYIFPLDATQITRQLARDGWSTYENNLWEQPMRTTGMADQPMRTRTSRRIIPATCCSRTRSRKKTKKNKADFQGPTLPLTVPQPLRQRGAWARKNC